MRKLFIGLGLLVALGLPTKGAINVYAAETSEPVVSETVDSEVSSEVVSTEVSSEVATEPSTSETIVDTATDWIEQVNYWLNQPLPIIGVSSLVLGAVILKIASMTSFGKKNIKNLTSVCERTKEYTTNHLIEQDIKISELEKRNKVLEDCLLLIADNSRNVNIKSIKAKILSQEVNVNGESEKAKDNETTKA